MSKNIIISILAVLLVIGVGWLYLGKTKLQGQIKTLESEKVVLQSKIEKSFAYAKSLDLLFEPGRMQAGIPTRQNFSNDKQWLSALTEATKATADDKLQNNLNDIKKGGDTASKATVLFMDHAVSAMADILK